MALIENIAQESIDQFKFITKIDIAELMERVVLFFDSGAIRIFNYYRGETTVYPTVSFYEADTIRKDLVKITEVFRANGNTFSGYDYWIMLELVEDALDRLDTVQNYSVWLRSPILNGQYGTSAEVDYVLRGGQTLEEESSDRDWETYCH